MDRFRICCVTWNVQGRSPESVGESLKQMLKKDALADAAKERERHESGNRERRGSGSRERRLSGVHRPDIYAIGLQEIPIGPQYLLMDSMFDDVWSEALGKVLYPLGFVRVKRMRMLATLLVVFLKREHLLQCRDIVGASTRSGIAGVLGNKGSVTVRMTVRGTSVCVVNSHLPAHDYLLAERVRSYNDAVMSQTIPVEETSKILFHDYVFWLGDLNFRLDDGVTAPTRPKSAPNGPAGKYAPTFEEVLEKVSGGSAKDLLKKNDQLLRCMQSGLAFSELKETLPSFPPTYKFVAGTNRYDPTKVPAWCDRILYNVNESNYQDFELELRQHSYNSYPALALSDHVPVYSLFSFKIFPESPVRVTFSDCMRNWTVGDDAYVRLTISKSHQINPFDWLGLFKKSFTSLEAYQSYMWMASAKQVPSETEDRCGVELAYPTTLLIPGEYVLLYFDHRSASVLGISNPFKVVAQGRLDEI